MRQKESLIQSHIENSMNRAYFVNTRGSSLVLSIVALGFAINGFGLSQNLIAFRTTAVATIVFNLFRYLYSRHLISSTDETDKGHRYSSTAAKVIIIINGILWAAIFNLILSETDPTSDTFYFTTIAATSFAAASIVALSSYRLIATLFNLLILAPFIILKTKQFLITGETHYLYMPALFVLLLVFAATYINQAYLNLAQLFRNEAELKYTNLSLKQAQEALIEQTKKVVHSSRLASLGEMASGVAHEVNNPLAIISGHIQQISAKNKLAAPIEKSFLEERVTKIESAIERISKIIKGLRDFSKQSDGEPFVPTSVKQIIQETVDLCGEKFKNRGINFEVNDDINTSVNCRPVQISQILINLLNNAFDEIKNDSSPQISLAAVVDADLVKIRVSNNGRPIPQAIREKIFEPFFTTKAIGSGTGLGLSISRGLAQDHGGDLHLLDANDCTVFELSLPKA